MAGFDGPLLPEPARGEGLLAPPREARDPVEWVRENLFPSKLDAVITVVLGTLLALGAVVLVRWAFEEARWGVITANLKLFLVGLYPAEEVPRVWLALLMLSVLTGLSGAVYGRAVRTLALYLAAGQLTIAALMVTAGMDALAVLAVALGGLAVVAGLVVATRLPPPRRLLLLAWLASAPVSLVLLHGIPGL